MLRSCAARARSLARLGCVILFKLIMNKAIFTCCILLISTSTLLADDQIQAKQVTSIPAEAPNKFYVSNRQPLAVSPLVKLPIGAIKPRGWLLHELQLETSGMTGHLEEISK